MLEMVNKEIC